MTFVQAPMELCFRLALSLDLHRDATGDVQFAGGSGLLGPGDTVGWEHRHLGWRLRQESIVQVWRPFTFFREVMVAGSFGFYEHEYHFAPMNDGTRIRDEVRFAAPMGAVGRVAERLFLRRRMIASLERRGAFLKRVAESGEWHKYLDGQAEVDARIYQAIQVASKDERAFVE